MIAEGYYLVSETVDFQERLLNRGCDTVKRKMWKPAEDARGNGMDWRS